MQLEFYGKSFMALIYGTVFKVKYEQCAEHITIRKIFEKQISFIAINNWECKG